MCSLLDNESNPFFFIASTTLTVRLSCFFFSLIRLEGVINKIVDMLGLQGSVQILRNLIFLLKNDECTNMLFLFTDKLSTSPKKDERLPSMGVRTYFL